MTKYAMLQAQPRVVRGKVVSADVRVYVNKEEIFRFSLGFEDAPQQTNNMDAWLQSVIHALKDGSVRKTIITAWKETRDYDVLYTVNRGKGRLKGKEANQNLFQYSFGRSQVVDVEITIDTVNYATLWSREHGKEYMAKRLKNGFFVGGGDGSS